MLGQLAGQFCKVLGLYVVGYAGSPEKFLSNNGFDAAFNYKEGNIKDNLRKYCPNRIDIYFDSVAGYDVFNHMDYEEKSLNDATPFFVSGAAKHHMNIVNGIKKVPKELVKAFRDNKKGKQVVHVADL